MAQSNAQHDLPADQGKPRHPDTVVKGFLRTVELYGDLVAVESLDGATQVTWRQVRDRAATLAAGLKRLGVRHNDTVALMLKNRPEFLYADLAIMALGATPFSIYATLPPLQIVPLLDNSDAKIVLCERAFLAQIQGAQQAWPALSTVVLLEGGEPGTINWTELERPGGDPSEFDFEGSVESVRPDDLATIVYTSGTTGPAKGVELPHSSVMAFATIVEYWLRYYPGQRILSWLPTAHTTERVAGHYLPILNGCKITFCDDPMNIMGAVKKVRPHIFFSPPRLWEKLKISIEKQWAALPEAEHNAVRQALDRGLQRVKLEQAEQPLPLDLAKACAEDDAKYFAPVRQAIGLDAEGLFVGSGGAMAPVALVEFFHAIGLPLDEAYGMTESAALGTRSPKDKIRIGTVGKAQPGVEVKLAEDGEILIRHAGVMRGYRKQPQATAEVMDAQGWLHTGDIGTVDADGYFRIVDRKKDIIINSFGKNMSPSNIEAALTGLSGLISQAVVVGDGRNYNVALLTVDTAHVRAWAAAHGKDGVDVDALCQKPELRAVVDAEIAKANAQLSRVEQIKKYRIVGGEWLPGSDAVTATMKLKRRAILSKYADDIEAMYAEQGRS
ncbi:MAG: AMP-dependent synthetase/ligase [Acidobacteriaceae bacterium]